MLAPRTVILGSGFAGLETAFLLRTHLDKDAAGRDRGGTRHGLWVGFASDEFIGWWVLRPPNGPDQPKVAGHAELGYRLMRRHWRRRYATEGSRELIRYGFTDLGLTRVFAQTMAVNTASRATMAAAGLTYVHAFISAEPYDPIPGSDQGEIEYEITRDAY